MIVATDMTNPGYSVLFALLLFIAASVWLGTMAQKAMEKKEFLKGFFLGNRGLGAWTLALTATVQSGGTFMGFPALVYSHGWIVLPEQTTLDIPGLATVNLCHLPYTNVGDVRPEDIENPEKPYHDKYTPYRPKDDGRWLLCGHIHQKWKTRNKMINCGVDVWDMKPVSIEEIKRIILNEQVD